MGGSAARTTAATTLGLGLLLGGAVACSDAEVTPVYGGPVVSDGSGTVSGGTANDGTASDAATGTGDSADETTGGTGGTGGTSSGSGSDSGGGSGTGTGDATGGGSTTGG